MTPNPSPPVEVTGIEESPERIWLSPICDSFADHGEGRTWASPAPDATCEDCHEPWVEYIRADLARHRAAELVEALKASLGYLLNAKIDLETGHPKATAIRTIERGLRRARAALRDGEGG